MQQGIESDFPSLVKIKLELGEPTLELMICELLLSTSKMLREGYAIDSKRLSSLSWEIVLSYHYIGLDELKYCLSQGIKGKYGQWYDKGFEAIIFDWLEKYISDRANISDEQSFNNHLNFKEENNFILPRQDPPKEKGSGHGNYFKPKK